MILKSCIKSDTRDQILRALGPIVWIALTISISLDRMGNPGLDFPIGFLLGFCIFGNLAYIYVTTQKLREKLK